MNYIDNDKYAYLALIELLVTLLFVAVGWYWLAIGWASLVLADLLTYEWTENPERYGWAGENPHLAGAAINAVTLIYFVGYLIYFVGYVIFFAF